MLVLPWGLQAGTPNVSLIKSSNKNSPKVFETVRYSIVVENTGTDTANNVVVTDLVPPGMQVTAISPGGALGGGTITWNLGNLACQTVSVTLTAFADTSGSWGSYLEVRDSDDVRAFSDLAGAPSSSSNWFLLEGLAGYSVTSVNSVVAYYEYRNNNATDTIRAAFSNEGNMATQEGVTVLPNLSALYPNDAVRSWDITGLGTWNYGSLSALALYVQHEEGGTSGTRQAWMDRVWAVANIQSCGTSVWFDAVVTNSLYNGDVVNNSATASGSNFGAVNSPNASFTVLGPELAVTKTAMPSLVAQGDLVEYILDYGNFVGGLSVFDDFNNNYGTGIVNIPNWNAVHSNPEFWRNTNGTLSHSGCGYGLAYRSDTPNFANGTVSVDVLIGTGGGTGDTALVFLYQDSGPLAGRFYKSKLYSGCGGSPSGYCIDVQTSAWSQVCGNAPISSFNPNAWNNLRVVIQDYVFYVYVNNVLEFTCQDSTNWVNLPGKAGVYNDGNCNQYDNFRIGDDIQALNVRLWDTLPACVSFVASTPTATVNGQLLSWNVGNMDGGQTGQIRYSVNTASCAPGTVVPNLASAKADNSRPRTDDSAITIILPVQKSVSPGTASPGDTVTYSIVYTATGGGTVVTDNHNDSSYAGRWRSQRNLNTAQVTEVAGGYLQFNSNVNDEFTAYGTTGRDGLVEADVYLREGQCNGLVLGYQGGRYYTLCMFIGYSPNDDQWRLNYYNGASSSTVASSAATVVIDPTNGSGNVWVNLKVIREANSFRIYLNNAYVMTLVDAANNLPGPGLQGYYNYGGDWRFDNFRWEPGYKSGVVVWDSVPANMSFVSATQGGTLTGGVVNWSVPNLSAGQSWTAQMVLRVSPSAPGGVINNTAYTQLQAGAQYNSGPIPLVVSVADVSLVKSVNQGTFVLGQTATYCFTWASTGSDPANVVIWDTLHPILTYIGSTAPGSLQVLGGNNVVVWNLGSQAPGANGSVCVWARVDAYPFRPLDLQRQFWALLRREPAWGSGP
jgi:uncharacterized repeat protein (TIGR01451 family)